MNKYKDINKHYEVLLKELTNSLDIQKDLPNLLAISKIVKNLTYTQLVSTQPTNRPLAAFYGVTPAYTKNGELTHLNSETHLGDIQNLKTITKLDILTTVQLTLNELYIDDSGLVYKALVTGPMVPAPYTTTNSIFDIQIGLMNNTIRPYTDAADTNRFEPGTTNGLTPYQIDFKISKWQCETKTRKASVNATLELLSNLDSNNLKSEDTINYLLALIMVQEINKDIIAKLITISQRLNYPELNVTNGIIELPKTNVDGLNTINIGRTLYAVIGAQLTQLLNNTELLPTWILVSKTVYSFLSSTGYLKFSKDTDELCAGLFNGIPVYIDTYNSQLNYIVVGTNNNISDTEMSLSLFYAPYEKESIKFSQVINPNSMSTGFCITSRYALSANPFAIPAEYNKDTNEPIAGDDWAKLSGKNMYSVITMINFK